MKILKTLWLLVYISVPIIGSGTDEDPYRPDLAADVLAIPGLAWTAQIPVTTGVPVFGDAIVWIPDSLPIPKTVVALPALTARATIKARTPQADDTHMEKMK